MSDNGPYTQPPQFPDGEGNPGGQPPYPGGPYGQPGPEQGGPHPGQQQPPGQYGSGPHQPPYGDPSGGQPGYQQQPPYGTGPQAGGPYQQPPEQPMYSGGQPPYGPGGPGGPVGPGGPGYPPPKKSNVGLWIVIAGGAVILVLVVAVVVMLIRGGTSSNPPVAQESDKPAPKESSKQDEGGGDSGPKGGPPYELSQNPCKALNEGTVEEYNLSDGSKNVSENSAICSWSAEGEGDGYGTLSVSYDTPYGGSDSVEGAKDDFKTNVETATDENNDYTERKVHEEEDVDLGNEAKLVFATENLIGTNDSVATMLIRQDNINVTVKYQMSPGLGADEKDPAPLKFSDVDAMMNDLGQKALNHVGSK